MAFLAMPNKSCTACVERLFVDRRCRDVFHCEVCGKPRSVCLHRPGGLASTVMECEICKEERVMGPEWVAKWRKSPEREKRHNAARSERRAAARAAAAA